MKVMAQQTTVEWLEELWYKSAGKLYREDFEKALAMEKEQINKACYDGYYQEEWYDVRNYYNDIYGKDHENTSNTSER